MPSTIPRSAEPASTRRAAAHDVDWRQRIWIWYARRPNHPMKFRLEGWLARALGLRHVQLSIPGPAVLHLPIGEHLTSAVAHYGCYEPRTLELALKLCRGATCFLDVGAQFGQYTLAAAAVLQGVGHVVAVEPNPQNYLGLARNIELNAGINIFPVLAAVSDSTGLLRLTPQTAGNTGATYTRTDIHAGEFIVPSLALSDLLSRLKITKVDVMKMDIEGNEPAALRGLFQDGAPRPRHILFEHLPSYFASCDETLALLEEQGYKLTQVDGKDFDPGSSPLEDNLWARLPVETS